MKILCIGHAKFEAPGYFAQWAKQNNHQFEIAHPYRGDTLPNPTDIDFLLVMGGPQSPLAMEKYPYLRDEIEYIKTVTALNKYVVGVCLGAQLIGEAYGAKTERSPHKEIGVFPCTLTVNGKDDPHFKELPDEFPVAHWHNDMPGITEDSVIVAKSDGCPQQIVQYQEKVYGFQCHFEFDQQCVAELIKYCPNDLDPGPYIQNADDMLNENYGAINGYLHQFLDSLTASS